VRRETVRLLLGVGAGTLLLLLFFKGVDFRAMGAAFSRADPVLLAASVAVSALTMVLRSWRWGELLRPLGRVGFLDLFSATVVGFMAGLVIPRAGEVLRPYLVSRRHAIRTSAGFASIILERIVDLVTVLLLFALYLRVLAPPGQIAPGLRSVLETSGLLAGAAALGALGVLVALHWRAEPVLRLADRVFGLLPARLGAALGRVLRSFASGLAILRVPPARMALLAAQSLLVWLSIALGLHLVIRAFDIALPFPGMFLLLGFLTVGVAIPTPGMVGGFHEAFLLALTEAFGVDRNAAAAAGVAAHAVSNLPVLLMGLALLGREGLTLRRVADMAEDGAPREAGQADAVAGQGA
jgi:hypothetical protein